MKGIEREMDRVCELCEQERASVVCSADAVMLCETCDSDIHPVNTRLSHHVRIPLSFSLNHHSADSDCQLPGRDGKKNGMEEMEIEKCFMQSPGASPVPNPSFNPSSNPNPNPNSNYSNYEGQGELVPELLSTDCMFYMEEYLNMEYIDSTDQFHVDLSIRDPSEANIVADHAKNGDGCNKIMMKSSSQGMTSSTQLMTDREMRVMRYKEKKKNRKFEKKIRYTSRKVYADTRPRIKGRFVKIAGTETEGNNKLQGSKSI